MNTLITDGLTGDTARVTNNRLNADVVSRGEDALAADQGDAYNVNTGSITLTTATVSAVFYMKNTGDIDLIIDQIFVIIGNTTAGSGDMLVDTIRNPTTGTIVSGAAAVDININRNFGSNNSINVDAFKGAEGNTITDGDVALGSILDAGPTTLVIQAGAIVLKKGSSIGVNITPPTGNTSMNVQVAMEVHEKQL